MFYLIVVVGVLIMLFPALGGFFKGIGGFLWKIVEIVLTPLMWLDNLISSEAITIFLTRPLVWLRDLLQPVLDLLPDSALMLLPVALLLTILFFLLKRPGDNINKLNAEQFLKLNLTWVCAAILVGIIVASSGHRESVNSVVCFTYDFPLTLDNIPEWAGNERFTLLYTMVGTIILSLIYLIFKGIRSVFRTWAGMALSVVVGCMIGAFRVWFVSNISGGILAYGFVIVEALLSLGMFLGFVVFILPHGAIVAINQMNAEKQMHGRSKTSDSSDIELKTRSVPSYVTDDDGNTYPVNIDGDFLYINGKNGRISVEWDEVQGSSYFIVDGVRFYLHFTEETYFDD